MNKKYICIKDIPDFNGYYKRYKCGDAFEVDDNNKIINSNAPYFLANLIHRRNELLSGEKSIIGDEIYEEVAINLNKYLITIAEYREMRINSILD